MAKKEKFQFPSNGKVDPNPLCLGLGILIGTMFQFPSNGKVDPNYLNQRLRDAADAVSIPFKRESGS